MKYVDQQVNVETFRDNYRLKCFLSLVRIKGGGEDGVNEFRNATVKVESQNVSLLVLTKDDFTN